MDDDVTILKAAFELTAASWPWVVIRKTVLSPVMKRNSWPEPLMYWLNWIENELLDDDPDVYAPYWDVPARLSLKTQCIFLVK